MPRCLYKSMQTHDGDVQRERDELLGKQTNKQTKTDNATVKKEHTTASQLEWQKRKSFFFFPCWSLCAKKKFRSQESPKSRATTVEGRKRHSRMFPRVATPFRDFNDLLTLHHGNEKVASIQWIKLFKSSNKS